MMVLVIRLNRSSTTETITVAIVHILHQGVIHLLHPIQVLRAAVEVQDRQEVVVAEQLVRAEVAINSLT